VDGRLLWLLGGLVLLQALPGAPGRGGIVPDGRTHQMDEAEVDSIAPLTGAPVALWIETLDGVPRDAAQREAFVRGFRSRFRERELPSERRGRSDRLWRPDATLLCDLRLADEPGEKGAWSVRVRLEWRVPSEPLADTTDRAWPGLAARVTVSATAPEPPAVRGLAATPNAAPPVSAGLWLRFPSGHPVDPAYLQLAGRQVAAVVMEVVQRARGQFGEDRRLRLEDTVRADSIAVR
jgi:hypothetical protein